jgi:hypothetical protein
VHQLSKSQIARFDARSQSLFYGSARQNVGADGKGPTCAGRRAARGSRRSPSGLDLLEARMRDGLKQGRILLEGSAQPDLGSSALTRGSKDPTRGSSDATHGLSVPDRGSSLRNTGRSPRPAGQDARPAIWSPRPAGRKTPRTGRSRDTVGRRARPTGRGPEPWVRRRDPWVRVRKSRIARSKNWGGRRVFTRLPAPAGGSAPPCSGCGRGSRRCLLPHLAGGGEEAGQEHLRGLVSQRGVFSSRTHCRGGRGRWQNR